MVRLLFKTSVAVTLLSLAAPATTWIVNASGGGNFTDIQTAILASQPGDVLLVQPGTYAPFALDRGLTIIGYGSCNVSGGITIAGVPATQTAALVDIEAPTLDVQSCDGAVIVQDTQQLESLSISNSLDVRLARVVMPNSVFSPSPNPVAGVALASSRLEVVDSHIDGATGATCASPAIQGAAGVSCAGSRLHMSSSWLWGGAGSSCTLQGYICANGGVGLDLQSGADAILCGRASDIYDGGPPGINTWYSTCTFDGQMGYPIWLGTGATLRHSGVTIRDHVLMFGTNCNTLTSPGVEQAGGLEVQPSLHDPFLNISGTPVAGGSVVVTLDAPVGSTALLGAGRKAVVVPDPNTLIEVLTPATRTVSLGQIPASGTATFSWHVPSVLAPGTKIFLQAEVSVAPGDVRRTNSIPVIVR